MTNEDIIEKKFEDNFLSIFNYLLSFTVITTILIIVSVVAAIISIFVVLISD